ncbi:ABC transporter A family member [Zostera marina]|uniref:ABC transporter A family member n=1 Tax=Zostera marina TaxID=29655 RepID=A0A0K9PK67_ZOSMR|nr:ABC transporter A family member [Zostera marina]
MCSSDKKCGCRCVDETDTDTKNCKKICGIQYSTAEQAFSCAIPNPPEWPPLLQVPRQEFRAVRTGKSSTDLPKESCRKTKSCPATVLFTGQNQDFATSVSQNFFTNSSILNMFVPISSTNTSTADILNSLSQLSLGTDADTDLTRFLEPGFFSGRPIYTIHSTCNASNSKYQVNIPILQNSRVIKIDVECVRAQNVWYEKDSLVNDVLFDGYRQASDDGSINEIMSAYDFLNCSSKNFNVDISYNSSLKGETLMENPPSLLRIIRSVNVVSNAYLQTMKGSLFKMVLKFTKEMPKPATEISLDIISFIAPIFFTWIIELLLPVFLTYLIYEKQNKLRIMMKMHGLGDGPYWLISYGYFLLTSIIYAVLLVTFGSFIGLKIFNMNDRSIQFVFFFSCINLQIALAFFIATFFSNVKSAQGIAYIYVFASGLLGDILFRTFVTDITFPKNGIIAMELIPTFSLYRGFYELGQYAFAGNYMGTSGMSWKNLNDGRNGMKESIIIMVVEWFIILLLAYYLDHLALSGSSFRRNWHQIFRKKNKLSSCSIQTLERQETEINVDDSIPDIAQEWMEVENFVHDQGTHYSVVSDNLKKTYPAQDGNPKKLAMIGLISPTSGNAFVHGHSIQTDMKKIYTSMGVCPQHDLLWETLTAREHLLFYGRLKNLKGSALIEAVEESLRSVNLFNGGVADKQSRKYSGGMKRRLSVAISLIGDPKVVYMDEPSTGLDPASRNSLWNAVKAAKENRAIILTTHSMEEAEVLCDRLGIFVDGTMQCIGNAKQLRARYGGSYIFTMTTSGTEAEQQVENLVLHLSPNAQKIYQISGTQKFEIPKQDVKISDIFKSVEVAKKKFSIQAWGISDTTLEDVFIKVAKIEDSITY